MKAFVLTGGRSLGAVHDGMLRTLYEQDIRPDLIVGASVEAVNENLEDSLGQDPGPCQDKLGVGVSVGLVRVGELRPGEHRSDPTADLGVLPVDNRGQSLCVER